MMNEIESISHDVRRVQKCDATLCFDKKILQTATKVVVYLEKLVHPIHLLEYADVTPESIFKARDTLISWVEYDPVCILDYF